MEPDLEVSVEPFVAYRRTRIGPVPEVFDQMHVVVNGQRIGYVHPSGGSVKLTIELPESTKDIISQKVAELLSSRTESEVASEPAVGPFRILEEDSPEAEADEPDFDEEY